MERFEVKFSASDVAETGEFSGYGAVFGNVDSHGDVIAPGAFRETLKVWNNRGSLPPMRLMHGAAGNPFTGSDLPVGVWKSMVEDDKGLRVEGKLTTGATRGRDAYELMKDGALGGLSIGYRAIKSVKGDGRTAPKRTLQEIALVELSVVDEPSNSRAKVLAVKSVLDLTADEIREVEGALRDAGFSRSDAVKAFAVFRDWSQRDAEAPKTSLRDEGFSDELAEIVRRNLEIIRT